MHTCLHIGATVITHKRNREFYEVELLNYVPRTPKPDMVSLYPPTELSEGYTMEDVDEKYVISDGERNLDIYYAQELAMHVEGWLSRNGCPHPRAGHAVDGSGPDDELVARRL